MLDDYQLLIQSIKDYAIFMLDPAGNITSWNSGAERMKGYSEQEIIGEHFSIFYTKDDKESQKPQRELEIAITNGRYEEEGWRLRKDGSRFWANVVVTPVFDEERRLLGFAKVTRDLTEKRRNEELYLLLIEQVREYAIFMLDENGSILTWNAGAERIKGYAATEILGKHYSIFYSQEDKDNDKPGHILKSAVANGQYNEEGWRVRKDGSKFWASVVVTPVYTDTHIGFAKVVRDLTERNDAERISKAHNLLEITNKDLERFAFIVSHDLKEPLRKIGTFADLLRRKDQDQLSENHKVYINKITNASQRLSTIVDDILNFSTLSEKPQFEKYSLQKCVDETVELLEQTIKEKNAVIQCDGLPEAIIIPGQFNQLFQNLILNSLKFSKVDAHPIIKIAHSYISKTDVPKEVLWPSDQYLQITFTDNGIGFDQANAEQIFQHFTRLHGKSEYEGTGLGLAICKKIVDNHGGAIKAQSTLGKGATFEIILPLL